MDRAITLAVATGFFCVLLLAIALGVDGCLHGAGANRQHPPGRVGAVMNVVIGLGFCGPTACGIGAAGGLGAGLVGGALRRLRGVKRR